MREKTYTVTVLMRRKLKVKAYDEIGAESEAIAMYAKPQNIHQIRVQRRGLDTGFYTPYSL